LKKKTLLFLENYNMKEVSFHKLILFSQGNHVPDAAASNTHGFLSRDTCIFST
jgi:hypothetical protein